MPDATPLWSAAKRSKAMYSPPMSSAWRPNDQCVGARCARYAAGTPDMAAAAGRQPYVTLLISRAREAIVFGRHNGA